VEFEPYSSNPELLQLLGDFIPRPLPGFALDQTGELLSPRPPAPTT